MLPGKPSCGGARPPDRHAWAARTGLFELAWALDRHRGFVERFAPVTFVGNHDVTRIRSQLHEPRHLAVAVAALLTLPGVPCVYYGDELGWHGVKEHRAGGDDAIRPPLPPADHAVTGTGTGDEAATLAVHRDLIALRRARPWLTRALLEVTSVENQRLAYTVTDPTDPAHRLDVVVTTGADTPAPPPDTRVLFAAPGCTLTEPTMCDPARTSATAGA